MWGPFRSDTCARDHASHRRALALSLVALVATLLRRWPVHLLRLHPKNWSQDKVPGLRLLHPCNAHACPVDGTYTGCSAWGTCTTSCGKGTQFATRGCNQPQNGGKACGSTFSKTQACDHGARPVHCATSAGSAWSTCSKSCEGGTQSRSRSVTSKRSAGGYLCPYLAETRTCNLAAWTA